MAFTKSYTLENGITGDHWQIQKLSFDYPRGSIIFHVGLWKDAQHCKDNKPSLTIVNAVLEGEAFGTWNMGLYHEVLNPNGKDPFTASNDSLALMDDKPWYGGTSVLDEFWYM